MPFDPKNPAGPAWRSVIKPGARKREARPHWQGNETPAGSARRRLSWRTKFAFAFGGFLLVSAVLVFVILLLRAPQVASIAVHSTTYQDSLLLPPNPYSQQALAGLMDITRTEEKGWLGWKQRALKKQGDPDRRLRQGPGWYEFLHDLSTPTIVYFPALHGHADAEPYLFTEDAAGSQRLYVKEILARLGDEQLRGKNKLLVLDAAQFSTDWPLGVLENDFARQLVPLSAEVEKVPGLVVLVSAGPGQRSWASDEWQTTAFAHYLTEGLRGAGFQGEGGRLTAWELFTYVKENVRAWAREQREAVQVPMLLPDNEEGINRARNMGLAVITRGSYVQPKRPDAPSFDDCIRRWEAWDQLRNRSPAPWAMHPARWRCYEEALLRYENHVRAGDAEGVKHWAGLIDGLQADWGIPGFSPASSPYALPAGEVLDPPAAADRDSGKREEHFQRLWQAEPKDRGKVWSEWAAGAGGPDAAARARTWVCARLLDPAAKDPRQNLKRACEILEVVGSGNHIPDEANFMAILDRDQGGVLDANPDLVQLALKTRRAAAQAALAAAPDSDWPAGYAAQVHPWVKKDVEAADRLRRPAEDRLFLSSAEEWTPARSDLQKALAQYEQITKAEKALARAFALRDQALAELPYLSRWAAGRRDTKADEGRLNDLEDLWKAVHQLDDLLAVPGGAEVEKVSECAETYVRPRFEKQEGYFTETCRRLEQQAEAIPPSWHEIDEVLAVPLIEPPVRKELLKKRGEISTKLEGRFEGHPLQHQDDDPSAEAHRASEAGKRQGRMVLAALGEGWVNRHRELARFDALRGAILQPESGRLVKQGEQLALLFAALPREARQTLDEAHTLKFDDAQKKLAEAERLARLMGGGRYPVDAAAAEGAAFLSANPALENRRLQLAALLLWEQARTYQDHWFAASSASPFYWDAGRAYLEDAQALIDGEKAWQTAKEAFLAPIVEARRQPRTELALPRPDPKIVTDEPRFALRFALKAPAGEPEGIVAVHLEAKGHAAARLADTAALKLRRDFPIGSNRQADIAYELKNDNPSARKAAESFTLTAWFRGDKPTCPATVQFDPEPDIVNYFRNPGPEARVAARVTKEYQSSAAVNIVLDWSHSMVDPGGDGRPKYKAARDALESLLASIPKGTRVRVYIFSRRQGNEQPEKSEFTKVEELFFADQWDGGHTDKNEVMDRVRKSEPYHLTPLVEAMVDAGDDLRKCKGSKTLIVLTDGEDNLYDEKYKDLRSETVSLHERYGTWQIPALLQAAFGDSDIAINMVFFRVPKAEVAGAQLFKVIESFRTPGTFAMENEVDQLASKLTRGLRPRLILRRSTGALPKDVPSSGLPAAAPDELVDHQFWSPFLDALSYSARIGNLREVDVDLRKGDRLLLLATHAGWKRGLYADCFPPSGSTVMPLVAKQDSGDWQLAVLENHWSEIDSSLRQMVTVEEKNHVSPGDDEIRQIKPGLVWVQVAPAGGTKVPRYSFGTLLRYPAAAWEVQVPDWPGRDVAPELRVWRFDEPEKYLKPWKTVKCDATSGVEYEVDGVRVELSLEPQKLRNSESQKLGKMEECLVVRASYPNKDPILVVVEDLDHKYREHRLFLNVNRYTGVFGPVSKDQLGRKLTLKLIKLESLKRTTEPVVFSLPAPNRNQRPQPPDDISR